MLTIEKITDARRALKGLARHTDLIKAPLLTSDCQLFLKPENLQFTGSFKLRGAGYKISCLTDEEKAHGVIACSAGNHAQGVALSATKCGIKSIVCMPASAPIMKVEATRAYGAEVVLVPGVYDDAYTKAVELQKEFGYTFVHPFNDENVIAGQGTIALEILDELADAEVIVGAIGGGGLMSGVAVAAKAVNPNVKVYGVQAEGAASMYEAVKQGKIVRLPQISTFADGIAVKEAGNLTFELVNKYLDGIVTVSEDEIAAAILTMLEKQKMIAEGAGAVGVAAVMTGKIPCNGK
ncbi:MAG: pyridoxal-phosphate dependent enzyme, partial [Clostridia bacterium]|nr:pyridoxal-phosphate dependent enzyme [Clostridia bacterium]